MDFMSQTKERSIKMRTVVGTYEGKLGVMRWKMLRTRLMKITRMKGLVAQHCYR